MVNRLTVCVGVAILAVFRTPNQRRTVLHLGSTFADLTKP